MTSDPVERYLTRSRRLQRRSVLRPMSGGELLDETLALYRASGAGLLIPLAVAALVMTAAENFFTSYVFFRLFETEQVDSVRGQMGEFVVNGALGLFVAAPIWIIALSYATAVSVRHVGWILLNQPTSPGEATRDARKTFPTLLRASAGVLLRSAAGLIIGVVVLLAGALISLEGASSRGIGQTMAVIGIVGLIVGFFWFIYAAGRFGLVAPVAVIEGLTGKALMRRTVDLIRATGRQGGAAGNVVALIVTSVFIKYVLESTMVQVLEGIDLPAIFRDRIGGALGEAVAGALIMLPGVLALTLVLPFFTTAITVLYFERRVRIEGYDITALASDIDPVRRSFGDA
ncbi:hypothetical protein EON79_01575 [bacterium]|nr:MAG: hypothetical protein EON79_01575 [bacterium]